MDSQTPFLTWIDQDTIGLNLRSCTKSMTSISDSEAQRLYEVFSQATIHLGHEVFRTLEQCQKVMAKLGAACVKLETVQRSMQSLHSENLRLRRLISLATESGLMPKDAIREILLTPEDVESKSFDGIIDLEKVKRELANHQASIVPLPYEYMTCKHLKAIDGQLQCTATSRKELMGLQQCGYCCYGPKSEIFECEKVCNANQLLNDSEHCLLVQREGQICKLCVFHPEYNPLESGSIGHIQDTMVCRHREIVNGKKQCVASDYQKSYVDSALCESCKYKPSSEDTVDTTIPDGRATVADAEKAIHVMSQAGKLTLEEGEPEFTEPVVQSIGISDSPIPNDDTTKLCAVIDAEDVKSDSYEFIEPVEDTETEAIRTCVECGSCHDERLVETGHVCGIQGYRKIKAEDIACDDFKSYKNDSILEDTTDDKTVLFPLLRPGDTLDMGDGTTKIKQKDGSIATVHSGTVAQKPEYVYKTCGSCREIEYCPEKTSGHRCKLGQDPVHPSTRSCDQYRLMKAWAEPVARDMSQDCLWTSGSSCERPEWSDEGKQECSPCRLFPFANEKPDEPTDYDIAAAQSTIPESDDEDPLIHYKRRERSD